MTFMWACRDYMHNCFLDSPVTIKIRDNVGGMRGFTTSDMGFIVAGLDKKFEANVYGTINADTPRKTFDNIDEAKAYVEQQALLGLTLNKLTR